MPRVKLITVQREKIDIDQLVIAAIDQDHEKMGELIDQALIFGGPGGAIIERIDQPVIAGLAEILCDAIDVAIDKTLEKLNQG